LSRDFIIEFKTKIQPCEATRRTIRAHHTAIALSPALPFDVCGIVATFV
jgi:hypothetical protein